MENWMDGEKGTYRKVFFLLSQCTEDYLYLYNLQTDQFMISEHAVKTFRLEENRFLHGQEALQSVVYPEDLPPLFDDIQKLKSGESTTHDMDYRWMGKDDRPIWINCRGQVIQDEQGKALYLIGQIAELGRKSKVDNVTGLYRESILREELDQYEMGEGKEAFLLQIGIDNFKDINEKYGQDFGDTILESTANCILEAVGENNRVFRLHGDEMIVLVKDYPQEGPDPAKTLYKEIRHLVDQSILDSGFHTFFTISAGSLYLDEQSEISGKLIEKTSFALHQAKLRGKNTCVRYLQEDYDSYVRKLDIQECLQRDITDGYRGFEIYYQPVVNIKKKEILGAEALIRWHSDKYGFMPPVEFVPLLEESGLIIPLGRWIVKEALLQCQKWQKEVPNFRISVNLSFVQLKKSDALKDILELIEEIDIDKNLVMFEVTESGELETGSAFSVLRAFKNEAIHLAIDDFGTGYSNLRYVRNMTFDLLKIDQSFITNIRRNPYDYLVVKQFTELAHALNLTVCYEGVETKEDLDCVLDLGPDYIQGYYFSKPVPAQEFEEKLLAKGEVF